MEIPFLHTRIEKRRIVDVGSCENLPPLELASLGNEVFALDIHGYPLVHPRLI